MRLRMSKAKVPKIKIPKETLTPGSLKAGMKGGFMAKMSETGKPKLKGGM